MAPASSAACAGACDAAATAATRANIGLASKDYPNIRALLAKAGAVPLLAVQLVGPSAAAGVDATALFLNISISTREQLAFAPDLLDALRARRHRAQPSLPQGPPLHHWRHKIVEDATAFVLPGGRVHRKR